MKVFVVHDDSGRIRGTLASADSHRIGVKPGNGLRAITVEAPSMAALELREFVRDLHRHHHVSMTGKEPLVRRHLQAPRREPKT